MCDYQAANEVHLSPSQRIAAGPYRTRMDAGLWPPPVQATRSTCSTTHRHLLEYGVIPAGWDRSPWSWELAQEPGLADGHPVP